MFHFRPGSQLREIIEDSERIAKLLEKEIALLQQIVDRLPELPTYHPTTGIAIVQN